MENEFFHRMAEESSVSICSNPWPCRDTQRIVPIIMYRQLLKISVEETPQLLWTTCVSAPSRTQRRSAA